MPKKYVGIQFDQYDIDAGPSFKIRSGFFEPEPFSVDQGFWEELAVTVGGRLVKYGTTVIEKANNPCPESLGIKPRKLKYVFSDGRSLAIPFVPNSPSFLYIASDILAKLQAALSGGVEVVCVELIGEEITNTLDLVNHTFDVNSSILSGGSGKYYSGYVSYQGDIVDPELIAVKSASAIEGEPPQILKPVWSACVGSFQPSYGCGSRQAVDHRRLILQYISEGDDGRAPESRELPVVDKNDILLCLQTVVEENANAIFCAAYKGEDRKNFLLKLDSNSAA